MKMETCPKSGHVESRDVRVGVFSNGAGQGGDKNLQGRAEKREIDWFDKSAYFC